MRKHGTIPLLLLGTLLLARPAWAPYHLTVIDQVFFGTDGAPDAQYIQLRTLASGQVFVNTQNFPTQHADGTDAGTFGTFTKNYTHAAPGVAILAGTQQAHDLFCVPLDLVTDGQLEFPDGRVCFGFDPVAADGTAVDCVAYGNYTGTNDNPSRGQPAVAPQRGVALTRASNTSDNQADFALQAPAPKNNAGALGAIDGTPGDPDGTGEVSINDLGDEVAVLFETPNGKRCDLSDPKRRGADANLDTRLSAADIIETIQIALPEHSRL